MLLYFVMKACNGFCCTEFTQSRGQQQRVSVKTISYLPSFNALNFFSLFHCFAVTELNQQRFLEVFITKRKLADLFTQFPRRLLYIPRARWLLEARALSSLATKISLITWVILFKVNLWIICLPSLFRRFPKHVGNVSFVNTCHLFAQSMWSDRTNRLREKKTANPVRQAWS